MTMKNIFFLSLVLLFVSPLQAQAARVWMFQGVEIENVEAILVGSSAAVRISINDPSGTETYSCTPTQQAGVVSFWASSFSSFMQGILSVALSALAQGSRVDIMVESSSCNDSSSWLNADGDVAGLGLEVRAIRIRQP